MKLIVRWILWFTVTFSLLSATSYAVPVATPEKEFDIEYPIGERIEIDDDMEIFIYKRVPRVKQAKTSGPIAVTIDSLHTKNLLLKNQHLRELMLGERDSIDMLSIYIIIENNGTEPADIYPNESRIVTREREDIASNVTFSDPIGRPLEPGERAEGFVHFFYDEDIENIDEITLIIDPARDEQLNDIGDGLEFELKI